jgi:predicted nucleic acid-binding protein
MRLDRVPAGTIVFIDANIFIYHFTGASPQCSTFLSRCEARQLEGVTGVHVLAEVAHCLMMIEAVRKGLVTPGGVAAKLREHPEVVRSLTDYQISVDTILSAGIRIVALTPEDLSLSAVVRSNSGLLVNDSLTAAMIQRERIPALATSDSDFERMQRLRLYSPTDLPWPTPAQ